MNSKLGHPDFLGLTEQVSVGGMGAAFSDEEEGKVVQPEKGGPALSWQSNIQQGTQRAGAPGDDWTWEDYDAGPDGIPGTEDDTMIPINIEEYEQWWENWYLPWAAGAFSSSTFGILSGMNTISGLGGKIPSFAQSANDPFNKFWYAWLFGVAEWSDIGDWVPGAEDWE